MADVGSPPGLPDGAAQRRAAAVADDVDDHGAGASSEAERPINPTRSASMWDAGVALLRSEGLALGGVGARTLVIVGLIAAQATAILLTVDRKVIDDRLVDRDTCSGCACWDGLSKAPYDKGRYKLVYWNMELGTAALLALFVFFAILLERALTALWAALASGRASWTAAAAFAVAMPGVMYGAGAMYHYYNDAFYTMVPTQTYFLVTETLTAACILRVVPLPKPASAAEAAREQAARAVCLWLVWSNAVCHVVLAGLDQIFLDLFVRSASITPHAYARAVVFSSTDFALLAWASWQLGMFARCCRGSHPPPDARTIAGWLAAAAVVCVWYRLFLPLV